MRQDVKSFVAACQVCQQMKASFLPPGGLLQTLPIPQMVFEGISMDFITGLPSSNGKTVILVVVDRLSKYGYFVGLPSNFTSITVAEVFVTDIIRLHGVPVEIVTDRDARFMSEFWKELHRLQGTTLAFSTSYHPQTDGQTEALNKCLEMYLRCYVADYPKKWLQFLPWAEYWYNTSYQSSAQMTPFEVLYGRPPPSISRYIHDSAGNSMVTTYMQQRDEVLALLKTNLSKAQNRMKLFADKHRRELIFQVGDWVYVKLQPYRQGSLRLQRHHKLDRQYFGPYQVIQRIGNVAYKLNLPDTAQIHSVFHVSLLRKCIGIPDQQITPLHLVDSTSTLILQPKAVLDTRQLSRSGRVIDQWLIDWEGLPLTSATWEDAIHISKKFPDFNLADKVRVNGGSTVVNTSNEIGPISKSIQQEPRKGLRSRKPSSRFTDFVMCATSAKK
ncbi:hypothetical protein GQ457_16G010950 [Hibiscus cannabinus]